MNPGAPVQIQVEILSGLGKELAITTEAETAAHIILNAADRIMGWDACYLILYDPAQKRAPRPLLAIDTVNEERLLQNNVAPQHPSENMLRAIETGGFLSQYEGFFTVDPDHSFGDQKQRTLSQLFVPVISGPRTIGVMSVQSYKKHYYDNEQLEILKVLASYCAGALERIWAQEALEEFVGRLKLLHGAVYAINASLDDMERVCQVVYDAVVKVMPCNDFVIDGYDEESNEIVPIYAIEHPAKRVFTNRYIADHGLAGEIVRTKKSLKFNNQQELNASGIRFELYSSFDEEPTTSILAVPMVLQGKIYGMVSAQSYQQNAYTDDDLYLLELLSSHAAVAIENARLFESTQSLANTDPLTKLLNRRHFFEVAETIFQEAQNSNTPLSVIMLDVDDFKMFNDRHGHAVGDLVLVYTAEALKNSLRSGDVLGRMGGEEFVVILPDTHLDTAYEIASRLRQAVQELDLSSIHDLARLNEKLFITVSVGVTEYDRSCKTLDQLIDRADQAMYSSKNSGRNRVRKWG